MTPIGKETAARAALFYLRVLLGCLFAFSILGKWTDLSGFTVMVGDYHMLSSALVKPAAIGIVTMETLCAVLFLFGFGLRWAGLLSATLFVIFTTAISFNLWHGNIIDCGCLDMPIFGSSKIGWHTLLRNSLFLAASWTVFYLSDRKPVHFYLRRSPPQA